MGAMIEPPPAETPAPLPNANTIIGALADTDRRRTLAAIELGAGTVDDIVARSGLAEHRVAKALARLVDSGLVTATGRSGLRVDADAFAAVARTTLYRPPSDEHAAEPPERRKVLQAFVRDGRITSMPTAPAKRAVVLDWLARTFEVGRHYSEAEVNDALAPHVEDHASLRRALVDAGLLDRDGVEYWRSGGSVV
jgi:hypothetical protein